MEANDCHCVEKWLHSISKLQLAVKTLQIKLDILDTRAASPPRWVSNPMVAINAGSSADSRQARYVEFLDEYPHQRKDLELAILERQQQLKCFDLVLKMLREENIRLAQLVDCKYLHKMNDQKIWEDVLYTSKSTFYRLKEQAVEAFYECLPGEFKKRDAS